MKNKNMLGLLLSCCLFILGFFIHGNIALYFNLSGLLIVCGGTLTATLISVKYEQLIIVCKVLRSAYRNPIKKETEIVNILIDLSIRSRAEGILSLQRQ